MPVSKKRKKPNSNETSSTDKRTGGLHWTWYLLGIFLIVGAVGLFKLTTGNPDTAHLNISVPILSGAALEGERVFSKNCSVCHGKNAAGSDNGPPLVHKIYEPNHHVDGSIYIAVKRGVRKHHWSFGNMPPISKVTDQQIATIISYLRTLQRANGIF